MSGKRFYVIFQIRQVELQFTVGEALSNVGAGRQSEAARDPWALDEPRVKSGDSEGSVMQELIDSVINKYSLSDVDYVRQVHIFF